MLMRSCFAFLGLALAAGLATHRAAGITPPQGQGGGVPVRYQVSERPAFPDTLRNLAGVVAVADDGIAIVGLSAYAILADAQGRVTQRIDLAKLSRVGSRRVLGGAYARDTLAVFFGESGENPTSLMYLGRTGALLTELPMAPLPSLAQATSVLPDSRGWVLHYREFRRGDTLLPRPVSWLRRVGPGSNPSALFSVEAPSGPMRVRGRNLAPIEAPALYLAGQPSGGIVVAPEAGYVLRFHPPGGGAPRVVRIPVDGIPVTPRYRQDAIARLQGDTAFVREATRTLESLRLPPFRPVVGGVWSAPDGRIAVRRRDLDAPPWDRPDSVTVDLLGADGVRLGTLRLPFGHQIRAYTGTALITSWSDTSQAETAKRQAHPGYEPPLRLSRFLVRR